MSEWIVQKIKGEKFSNIFQVVADDLDFIGIVEHEEAVKIKNAHNKFVDALRGEIVKVKIGDLNSTRVLGNYWPERT